MKKDLKNMFISFIFLFILSLPVLLVLFEAFGFSVLLVIGLIPLGWFILDSEISHYEMDEYLHEA